MSKETDYITGIQQGLDLPSCFVLSQEMLMSSETIMILVDKLLTNTANVGDKYAILEIIKLWLDGQNQTIRQGHWIDDNGDQRCPFCHVLRDSIHGQYCSNCGAQMLNGGENDE